MTKNTVRLLKYPKGKIIINCAGSVSKLIRDQKTASDRWRCT